MGQESQPSHRWTLRTLALYVWLSSGWAGPAAGIDPHLEWEGVLNEKVKLLASDGADGDFFGTGIAMDGNTLVIAAPGDDDGGDASGSLYVFLRQGGTWTEAAKLVASTPADFDQLGLYVAVAGDTVAATVFDARGTVHVFERPPGGWSGTVTEVATLLPADGSSNNTDHIAAEGDTIFVGGFVPAAGIGTVFVYERLPEAGPGW